MLEDLNRGPLGALGRADGGCLFRVWAPHRSRVQVLLEGDKEREVLLCAREHGYHEGWCEDVAPGDLYRFHLDEKIVRPDPASRAQPRGVHGPSMVVDSSFEWSDDRWRGLPLAEYVFYEIHTGTFTKQGTFESVIPHLKGLRDLGITCLEIMPVAQFPGSRNWGYDGVFPYAAQWSYGGIDGLRRLVDSCHAIGMAVCLDVVYNHLGPEGNYLRDYGPYFTERYRTPWGEAINFDDRFADEVRHFFVENARWWIEDVHVDALRLDAVHAIFDQSAWPFLSDVGEAVSRVAERLGRRVHVIAESDLHDPRTLRPRQLGGHGMDAEWNDDLHHAVHSLLTGESQGYYADFGSVTDLASAYGSVYSHAGCWTPSRGRRHGAVAEESSGKRFVVCAQNHDQVGNRMNGERLSMLVSYESLKLAAGTVLLSPYLPLIFMGEEYGETAPFLYFVDHGDQQLLEAVRKGRAREFASFGWEREPPNPAGIEVFDDSRLDRDAARKPEGVALHSLYRELLRLRRKHPALGAGSLNYVEARADEKRECVYVRRWKGQNEVVIVLNFSRSVEEIPLAVHKGEWNVLLDSAETRWEGPGSHLDGRLHSDGELKLKMSSRSFVLLEKKPDEQEV